jgi:hypothetical protein
MCGEHHDQEDGITVFIRHFECPDCGTICKDKWCADCNDQCPTCRAEIEPTAEMGESIVIEEAVLD